MPDIPFYVFPFDAAEIFFGLLNAEVKHRNHNVQIEKAVALHGHLFFPDRLYVRFLKEIEDQWNIWNIEADKLLFNQYLMGNTHGICMSIRPKGVDLAQPLHQFVAHG